MFLRVNFEVPPKETNLLSKILSKEIKNFEILFRSHPGIHRLEKETKSKR